MKYISEFRDPKLVKQILEEIHKKAKKEVTIMEVCGTHTMSIFRYGIRQLLPDTIKLISGPGCPVCVTSQGYMDTAIELVQRDNVILAVFGDMMRVPGSNSSLQKEKATGKEVRMVYSPLDAVKIAEQNPDKEVVFLGIGFETTAPTIALSVKMAYEKQIRNYSILQGIKTMPHAMKHLVLDPEIKIDGFLCPGHVSAVIGVKPYEFLAKEQGIPAVIAGFEPMDLVVGIFELVSRILEKQPSVHNGYSRLVAYEGNKRALTLLEEVFENTPSDWRGLGIVPQTGLQLKQQYKQFDVQQKLNIEMIAEKPAKGCICGEILKGKKTPLQCKLFGKACNPMQPVGACMVSEEGTCAAYYKYHSKEGES